VQQVGVKYYVVILNYISLYLFQLSDDGFSQKPKHMARNKTDTNVTVTDTLYFHFAQWLNIMLVLSCKYKRNNSKRMTVVLWVLYGTRGVVYSHPVHLPFVVELYSHLPEPFHTTILPVLSLLWPCFFGSLFIYGLFEYCVLIWYIAYMCIYKVHSEMPKSSVIFVQKRCVRLYFIYSVRMSWNWVRPVH